MVDINERFSSSLEAINSVVDGKQPKVWTSIPGIIESFDPDAVTCTATPAIMYQQRDENDKVSFHPITLLTDIPVIFPRGGGYTLTFPIAKGDECELRFQCRNIDSWWQSGGIQQPQTPRLHDISDAMAYVGPQSQAKKISGISTTTAQLRSDSGATFVEVSSDTITLKATHIVMQSTTMTTTGTITNNGKHIDSTHTHNQGVDGHGDSEQPTNPPN
jgi:hypothetical protein